ncbi:patatin-like phospholipase family protein [Oceaniserpentilla sp. 4NH20-0058]|uniref:patatin-like phospholipase family protein n=1 Tax=Oceaniserpentilla sp. 4NH20-0058 TaxID=3127660 RepID=UPI00310C2DEA
MVQKTTDKKVGLVLSGGGARAAYQVGVLKAIIRLLPQESPNPFQVISGTSAGAINAVALGSYAGHYRQGIQRLEHIWKNFSCDQIFKSDFLSVLQWSSKFIFNTFFGYKSGDPVSLLNNEPLRHLLKKVILFENIQKAIDNHDLHALSITASGYASGESVSFFQAHKSIKNWQRLRRVGVRSRIHVEHLLASSAIPAVFPAIQINREYFGDGAIRQLAPISPALHLGADKILVIGVSGSAHKRKPREPMKHYPSMAKIMNHMFNAAFLDSMESDVERLTRINNTISKIPERVMITEGIGLKPVDILEINPSESIDDIAARHARELPKSLRLFLKGSGTTHKSGAGVLSYLLFEKGFCRELIQCGYDDAMKRKEDIQRFFEIPESPKKT